MTLPIDLSSIDKLVFALSGRMKIPQLNQGQIKDKRSDGFIFFREKKKEKKVTAASVATDETQ